MNLKNILILILMSVLVLVIFIGVAEANELVWIEAPDSAESHMPFELKVHIEDPDVIKYATKIYLRPNGGGNQYMEKGGDTLQSSNHDYNGQEEYTFDVYGSYDDYYFDNTINFTVYFESDRETLLKDFDPSEIDYHAGVGQVSKLIEILPIKGTGSFPSYPDCPRVEHFQPEGVTYYSCQYNGDDEHPRVWSASRSVIRHACIPDKYYIENDYIGCYYLKRSMIGTSEGDGEWVSREYSSHTWGVMGAGDGTSEGIMDMTTNIGSSVTYTEEDEKGDEVTKHLVSFGINYYQKSGQLDYQGYIHKTMWLEKDEVEGEKSTIISEAEDFVASVVFSKQGSLDPSKDYKSKYTSYLPGKLQDTELYVYGYLKNKDDNPLPYMLVEVYMGGKKEYEGYTTLNGDYEIELKDLKLKEDEELNATVIFNFDYHRDGKNYYKLFSCNLATQNYKAACMWQDIVITPDSNVQLNLDVDGGRNIGLKCSCGSHINMRDYATIYHRMHEAVEFAVQRLHLDLDYKLPVELLIGRNDQETLYSPDKSMIKIAKSDESYFSSDNPRNREYHEFAHHIMYDIYGSWTGNAGMSGVVNHDGFINPTSADSFDEGFAEFMALAMAKYHGYKDADIYAGFGSMEDNYKPWDSKGRLEEFAIASLLWDMIDSNNEPGDSLTMTLDDVWRVIAVKQDDVFGYYNAFVKRFPEKKESIDDLFVLHGFFADTREGNKKLDAFEPYRDTNNDGRYSQGDMYVDLSCTKLPCNITYEKGMTIGQATNYDRKTRSQSVRVADAFLKVDSEGPRFYNITVDYDNPERETYSYIVEMKEGLVYVHPRPDDTAATIKVVPESKDYSYKSGFEIKNSQLLNNTYTNDGKGYFAEHDFDLTKEGEGNDPEYAEEDYEPSYTNDDRRNEKISENIEGFKDTIGNLSGNRSSNLFIWLFTLLIIGGAGFFGYKFVTDKKTKETTKKTYSKVKESAKKLHKDIKKKIFQR